MKALGVKLDRSDSTLIRDPEVDLECLQPEQLPTLLENLNKKPVSLKDQ